MYDFLNINNIKTHLNVSTDFTDDDIYLSGLSDVAFISIENYCNISLSGYTSDTIPSAIKQSALLIIGNLYMNREPVSFANANLIPFTINWLLDPYINFQSNISGTTDNNYY